MNDSIFTPNKVIGCTWSVIPGYMLRFPVGIALSGDMSKEREQTISLNLDERSGRVLEFRTKLLSDILTADPKMISFEKLTEIKKKLEEEKRELLPGELEELEEGLPEYPAVEPGSTVASRALEYFSRADPRGAKIFQLLIEKIIVEYWDWATPRPTISVLDFLQTKPDTTTVSSGS